MERRFACAVDDLKEGTSMTVAGEPAIALFRTDGGQFYATSDTCTHEEWSLGEESVLDGDEVLCPLHLACYDVRTGEAKCLPATEDLKTYSVEISGDGEVFVIVP